MPPRAYPWSGRVITDTGDSGDTSQDYKDAVLRRINFVRAMAGLPDGVTFNSTFSAKSQDAALMMSANNQLSHFPPNSWTFWTADGREAAENSNIAIGSAGPDSVMGYIEDHGANNAVVGHRRWLLYPQTEVMGTGDVPGDRRRFERAGQLHLGFRRQFRRDPDRPPARVSWPGHLPGMFLIPLSILAGRLR